MRNPTHGTWLCWWLLGNRYPDDRNVSISSSMTKSVLITGCTPGGIGHALAREFKSKGLRVFATARKRDTISDLDAEGIETLSLELTSEESITALKAEIESRTGGRLDILVNAGRNYTVPAFDF